jgi:hypothetical protein
LSVSIESSVGRFLDKRYRVCRFDKNSNQNGIISYLAKRFRGHVIDRNLISITASSITQSQCYPLRRVADFENQDMFVTAKKAKAWICCDFKGMQIKVTHYCVRSRRDCNDTHLRSWILEGSQNGSNWVKIDNRTNDTSLNSTGAISAFSISESFQEEFRQIRLR